MSLVDRVKAILLTPQKEWPVIEGESATASSLYTGYIVPLAAIGPVAGLIGMSMFGFGGGVFKIPIGIGLRWASISYVSTLVGVFVLALIIDALAPQFGGTKSQIQALKLAAYSSTAAWVAGIFAIIPSLGILGIVGLYSLYLLFLGLPVMMKSPQDKSVAYTVVVIVVGIVIFWAIRTLTWRVMGLGPMMAVLPN